MRKITLLILTIGLTLNLSAQDAAEEQQAEPYVPEKQESVIDQQLFETLPEWQIKWLGEGDNRFLARSKVSESGPAIGNILILPAPGKTVDSRGYVRRAFEYFPTVSWNVMAVSTGDLSFAGPIVKMPEAGTAETTATTGTANEATETALEPMVVPEQEWYEEQQKTNQDKVINRMLAAEKVLPEPQVGYVLIASKASASLLMNAIKEQQINPKALVLIDIDHPVMMYRNQLVNQLRDVSQPVLDIYQPMSRELAELRKPLARSPTYQQRMIPAVDADYLGNEDILLRSIRGWLLKTMPK